jgi:hypothetical protein
MAERKMAATLRAELARGVNPCDREPSGVLD